jgi:hypothetical protein
MKTISLAKTEKGFLKNKTLESWNIFRTKNMRAPGSMANIPLPD